MANIKNPPEAWVNAAFEALAEGGPDAIRVELLATALGVSKGGFYWHFSNRAELLDRVLATWEEAVVDAVIATVDAGSDDPRDKVRELFEIAIAFGLEGDGIAVEAAIRDWARRDPDVAARLAHVDERRVSYMRSLFAGFCDDADDIEARCLIVYALFVSSPLVHVHHPGQDRASVIRQAASLILR